MEKESNGSGVERNFEKLGVWVTVPPQAEDRPLVISDPLEYPDAMPATPGVFQPLRLVINFQVEEVDGTLVRQFDPPMKLRVGLTKYDFGQLRKGESLKLAFWDDEEKKWILFTEEKHGLVIDEDKLEASASIEHWGDPGLGAGR